jgi:hypothetical protein
MLLALEIALEIDEAAFSPCTSAGKTRIFAIG